jgi:hypothetical protein
MELDKLALRMSSICGAEVKMDDSVTNIIYSEGVFPTQGTRPLYTTINQLLSSKIGKLYYEIQFCKEEVHTIMIRFEDTRFRFSLEDRRGNVLHCFDEITELNLEKIRKEKKDDMQAITAVHEAGHAVLTMALLNILPEYAYSVTADADSGGFVYTRMKAQFVAKSHIRQRVAVMMGGIVAERLVFGDEHVTAGAQNDLLKATKFVSEMVKGAGLGSVTASVNVKDVMTNGYIFDEGNKLQEEILGILKEGESLAKRTLTHEKKLLLHIADHLSDHRMLKKEQMAELLRQHAREIDTAFVCSGRTHDHYRNRLKSQLLVEQQEAGLGNAGLGESFRLNCGNEHKSENNKTV